MSHRLQGLVDSIVAATSGLPDAETLRAWSPPLSGDLDLYIDGDGFWFHAGTPIQREGLVRLFASLLRREVDGDYYLVTPVEKWRIRVERHPLLVIDFDRTGNNGDTVWFALLNTGGRCHLGGQYALHPMLSDAPAHAPTHVPEYRTHHADIENGGPETARAPWLELPNGLSAQLTRASWYRLVEDATIIEDRAAIVSAGVTIELGSIT